MPSTKTYSEQRQDVYRRAAIDLYKLVVEIADENIDNPPEGVENVTEANKVWAASLIDTTFRKAHELDDLAHGETIMPVRASNRLARYRAAAQARTGEGRALKAKILAKLNT